MCSLSLPRPGSARTTSPKETRHLLTQSQDLQMSLSYKCTDSIGFIRGQRFAKKLPKSLEDGSATTSSGNAAHRTVPAASYRPSVRHCFKGQQMSTKSQDMQQNHSQVRRYQGVFSPECSTKQGKQRACNRSVQLKVNSSLNGFENQTPPSPRHANAPAKRFVQIKTRVVTNCLLLWVPVV